MNFALNTTLFFMFNLAISAIFDRINSIKWLKNAMKEVIEKMSYLSDSEIYSLWKYLNGLFE